MFASFEASLKINWTLYLSISTCCCDVQHNVDVRLRVRIFNIFLTLKFVETYHVEVAFHVENIYELQYWRIFDTGLAKYPPKLIKGWTRTRTRQDHCHTAGADPDSSNGSASTRDPSDFHPHILNPIPNLQKNVCICGSQSLQMDVFFFSVSIKLFEPIKDLVFSVHLLLYTVLQLYFHSYFHSSSLLIRCQL